MIANFRWTLQYLKIIPYLRFLLLIPILDELNCIHPTIQLNAEGGVSYVWDNSLGTSNSIMIDTAGIYEVIGVGLNGCENMASIIITEDFITPKIDIVNMTGTDTMDCNLSSIELRQLKGLMSG